MGLRFKLGLAIISAALIVLGWYAHSMSNIIRQQNGEIRELKVALATKSQEQAFAVQNECAASAQRFLSTIGWRGTDVGSTYENHFNSRLNKCFVLVSEYIVKDDFRTLDLYDAIEGRRYATYNGHDVCEVAFTRKPKKCALDSGSIWFDGNDSRLPADFVIGFRGLLFGGGAGDENTQRTFRDHVRSFMTQ